MNAEDALSEFVGYDINQKRKSNSLQLWGNRETMNMNTMVLTNVKQSPYFKQELIEKTTFFEIVDEIYYKVSHLEPWERGSRRTTGLSGASGGGLQVRGVGAGGIVSTAYCLLYKLFTLKINRKQLQTLLDHPDSPYIRAIGFMFIRYCIDPKEYWEWFEPYLDDQEELDVKAGGGCRITIGEMLRQFLSKFEWYSTLFPRIPVPVDRELRPKLAARAAKIAGAVGGGDADYAGDEREDVQRGGSRGGTRDSRRSRSRTSDQQQQHHHHHHYHHHHHHNQQEEEQSQRRSTRSRSRDDRNGARRHRDRNEDRDRDRDRDRNEDRDRDRDRDRNEDRDRDRDRDRNEDRDRDRDRDRNEDRDRDRDRNEDRDRDRDRRHHRHHRHRRHSDDQEHQQQRHRHRRYSRDRDCVRRDR